MSTLQLTVKDAQLLKSTQLIGKMENYVRVKVRGHAQEFRTKIVQGSAKTKKQENRISWNETLNIPIPQHNRSNVTLEVCVMDQDMGSDEVAAKGIINVQNCLMLSPVQNDYKLLLGFDPKNEKDNNAGDLTLSTRFV